MKTAPEIKDLIFAIRGLGLIVMGIIGFFVLWSVLHVIWLGQHEKSAQTLCDSFPIGMPASVAKARAFELSKSLSDDVIVYSSFMGWGFVSPYDPSTRIICKIDIFENKVSSNEARTLD